MSVPHPVWSDLVVKAWCYLGVFAVVSGLVALILEFAGLWHADDRIPPLTQIVSTHVPEWITLVVCVAITAFGVWLTRHFVLTYHDLASR